MFNNKRLDRIEYEITVNAEIAKYTEQKHTRLICNLRDELLAANNKIDELKARIDSMLSTSE